MKTTPPDNAVHGREQLAAWEASKPRDFYSADSNLQTVLRRYLGARYPEFEDRLRAFGAVCATVIDEAARIEDRIGNHPRVQRWTAIGERVEAIEFHPHHDLIGRQIWDAGVMALQAQPGSTVAQMGLYYLLGQNGEGGHMCSLACTSGLIRALQQVGDPALQAKFLPPLLTPDYTRMQHGAQFLTEVQGGSDVGANAISAEDAGDGTWRITGEKWFCSNINADQFLLTARPRGAADGTRGLGLFIVPRVLDDGHTNAFTIRRLKDKLGTRTLASAEVDFAGALAYPLGALDRGFKNVVELVLNTSRLMNAVGCAGAMRRAWVEASSYACHREAFGTAIVRYPLVQEALVEIMTETQAAVASTFYLAHLLDQIETGAADEQTHALYRLLVNVNKYLTSIRLSEVVHRAIEVFGGNGAIESFSVLPRLYRDAIVYESWEGTHNVLALQVLRDCTRYDLLTPFADMIQRVLGTAAHLREDADVVAEALRGCQAMMARLGESGGRYAEAHARRAIERIGVIAQAALLIAEAEWEIGAGLGSAKADVVSVFVNRHLRAGYTPLDDAHYLARLERMAGAT